MKKERNKNPIQPVSGTKVPRFAGPSTFARLPELRDVESCDVAIVGIPFDAGTSYRPGARFGPQSIRQASRHLRTNYHPSYDVEPFKIQQVADAGDIACNPFSIDEAIRQIEIAILGYSIRAPTYLVIIRRSYEEKSITYYCRHVVKHAFKPF